MNKKLNCMEGVILVIFMFSFHVFASYSLKLANSRADGEVLDFSLQNYKLETVFLDGKEYTSIDMEVFPLQ